ncbi:MAG: HAMP domain-containing sensor histidine kinase [Roseiflexaceae bacterium]
MDETYTTGVPFLGNEVPIQLDRHDAGDLEQSFLNFIYAPLRDASEQITGIFVHAVDVTELVTARQRAEAAVVVRDQFLSIAAHELKTPLTSVIGYIQLLQRRMRRTGNVDDRTDHVMTLIGAQSQRLNRLIDTLLDVARINMGQLSLELALLDLRELTTQVVDEVRVIAEHRAIHVTVPPEECVVQADSLRLEQVLVNLLQNALKYSPNGGDVDVTVQCTQSEARVSIRDTGIGIPAAALPHLFDRFYRVAEDAASNIRGMGIGLSVVDEIMTLHGGTISVESTEGVGSIFTIALPLAESRESTRGE